MSTIRSTLDPPYISRRGVGVDYHNFYFLEGLARYDEWPGLVDYRSEHRRMKRVISPWVDPRENKKALMRVVERFRDSIPVLSYRADGIPSVAELVALVGDVKRHVRVYTFDGYRYILSKRRTAEVLITD